jgi:hypothetical protein
MMAHGFEGAMLGQLVVDGLALATPHHTQAGRRQMIVVWISITTTAGRRLRADRLILPQRCLKSAARCCAGSTSARARAWRPVARCVLLELSASGPFLGGNGNRLTNSD